MPVAIIGFPIPEPNTIFQAQIQHERIKAV